MENFDRGPRSYNPRELLDIQKAAVLKGYEIDMLENGPTEIRFQVLSAEQIGFGEEEHEEFLNTLFETSTLLTPANTRMKIHPNHEINIIITPQ